MVTGPSAVSSSGQSILLPECIGHTKSRGSLAAALLYQASDAITRACLLTSLLEESGAWLHSVPNSSLGLKMDSEIIRVTVGLHHGVPLCSRHSYQHCGAAYDRFGLLVLSCHFNTGPYNHHAALNDIYAAQYTMAAGDVASQAEDL